MSSQIEVSKAHIETQRDMRDSFVRLTKEVEVHGKTQFGYSRNKQASRIAKPLVEKWGFKLPELELAVDDFLISNGSKQLALDTVSEIEYAARFHFIGNSLARGPVKKGLAEIEERIKSHSQS